MSAVKVMFEHGRSWVTGPVAHLLTSGVDADHIIAYPRSGSTWLRTMIVNVLEPSAQSNPDIFNKLIPGVTLSRLPLVWRRPRPNLLMSHAMYFGGRKKTVYVIRDGRDSVLSLFRYTTTRMGTEVSFSKWLDYYLRGYFGPRWDQHVRSWLTYGKARIGEDFLLVRYEDMRSDTSSVLERVCGHLGIATRDDRIENAVDMARVEVMRKWERKTFGEIKDANASFYRGGNREWESIPSDEDKSKMLNVSGEALALAGYEI